jgi:predicted transcriptional regulator
MEDLFGGTVKATPQAERVLMSLDQQWLQLMFTGEKAHEFRKRFPLGVATEWYVYLTSPTSRLAAIIDLDPAIEGSPEEIGEIAELTKTGNGASVTQYLSQRGSGVALPIRRVREYHGISAETLRQRLGSWHPPQGYMRLNANPALSALCAELPSTGLVRETTIEPPVPASVS